MALTDGLPEIRFGAAECTFCGACAKACPAPVFTETSAPFAHMIAIGSSCFPAAGIVCQSCSDACPEGAISFRPRIGGPPLPSVVHDRCNGCGACIAACPAGALSATPLREMAHA